MGLTLNEMYLKKQTNLTDCDIFLMTNKQKDDLVKDIQSFLLKNPLPEVWHGYPPVCPTHKIVLKK